MINITTTPNQNPNIQKKPSFNGAFELATQGFQLLNESPAIGATIVDVSSMALPRTIVDSKRGFNAGLETGIRETNRIIGETTVTAEDYIKGKYYGNQNNKISKP